MKVRLPLPEPPLTDAQMEELALGMQADSEYVSLEVSLSCCFSAFLDYLAIAYK